MRSITEVSDLKGKYVLLRASLNVPLEDDEVRNRFRLDRALPTLRYLHEQGARTIILSHLGRDPHDSLKPVFAVLEKHLPMQWGGVVTGEHFLERRALMADGDFLMAENLRQDDREKSNDPNLVAHLASLGELYVNDAFAEAHREHASTFGLVGALPAYAGVTLAEEVLELTKVMTPEHPSLFLLGGAKFETKMPLIEKYLEVYDTVFIGGALTNDILKARGLEVGQSMVSDVSLKDAPFLHHEKLLVPIDVVVDGPQGQLTKAADAVLPEERILDAGPKTVALLAEHIAKAKTILWNGPFGAYEMGYTEATEATAKLIAEADAFSVLGGGDTVAAVEKLGLNDKFGFISTGGGSTLTFLETGTTTVLERLSQSEG